MTRAAIQIVGGVYRERVMRPAHFELLGSAGRAAAAIGGERALITLHTAIAESDVLDLTNQAKASDFKLNIRTSPQTLSFAYVHGLDAPLIFPSPHIVRRTSMSVRGKKVLCFGALDIDWEVEGDQVVFDPQDAFAPVSFRDRGSKAKRLAIVLNQYEARLLTGEEDTGAQIKALFKIERPDVVVLKCGAQGTVVTTSSKQREVIPPLITHAVFKVGSGDVFSAMFAWAWMCEGNSPVESARIASAATANYVATRNLPIPIAFDEDNAAYGIAAPSRPAQAARVYLAGPFFSLAERWLIEESRLHLSDGGLSVFSPYHDVGLGRADEVAPKDLEAIQACDVVYAIVSNLDAGTLFEIGYARAIDKPVIALVENERNEDLKMLAGSGCVLEKDFATSIYKAVWKGRFG
jgi:nucleoside 2-deoxyribosyltransferase